MGASFFPPCSVRDVRRAKIASVAFVATVEVERRMPRFQIFVGEEELAKALSYLILVQGMTPKAAMDWLRQLLVFWYERAGESRYSFVEEATGSEAFDLQKKYRLLFGEGVQIKRID
ncbi:MAG: hypothetical protein L7F78_01735 [Syntrophales bacterium LBB04]|nr:hypothetical protein [Syntrophales bacterium LBB04]